MKKTRSNKSERVATLTAEEELQLLKIAKFETGKRKASALKSLIYHNLNLVKHIVRGFWSYLGEQGEDNREELLSEGVMAIPKAVDKFDINSKNRFATYAGYWIKQFIQSAVSKNQIINQTSSDQSYSEKNNKNSEEENNRKFVKQKYKLVYYDKKYPSGGGDSKSYSLIDIISDRKDNIEEQIKKTDLRIHSNRMISTLDKLEDLVIRLYFAIIPLNLSHINKICTEEEKKDIESLLAKKSLKKREISEISIEEVKNNKIVKKYNDLFCEQHKTKEIAEIIGKADGVVRKLKQKAIKKMRTFGQENGLDSLV